MLGHKEIERLLPHSGQMVFIHRVVQYGDISVTTEVDTDKLTLLHTEKGIPSYAGIELMAQSVAVWSGLIRQADNQPPQPGFLLGTRKYECQIPYFELGSTLRIHAEEVVNNEGLAVFQCILAGDDEDYAFAEARISVYSAELDSIVN